MSICWPFPAIAALLPFLPPETRGGVWPATVHWTELFQYPVIATVFLDRLLHNSVVINMRGNSYRLREKVGKGGWK